MDTPAAASRHFQAVAALVGARHDYSGGASPVAEVIRSWPDGDGEENAAAAWARMLAKQEQIEADMLEAMEDRFGTSVWALPEMGEVVVKCARLAAGTRSSYGPDKDAAEAFCLGARQLDDALWRGLSTRRPVLNEMTAWLQRERGHGAGLGNCVAAVFEKDFAVFEGAPPRDVSMTRGAAWLPARPYWQWIKHREDLSAWRRGGHDTCEEGWDDAGTQARAGAWLAHYAPDLARGLMDGASSVEKSIPDFSGYRKTLETVSKDKEGVDTLVNALVSHPQWLDYRDPETGLTGLLTLCSAKPALLRRAMLLAEKNPEWREAIAGTSGHGLGAWEYIVTHGYGDAWSRLLIDGIGGRPFGEMLAEMAPPRAGWLARAILWEKPSFSLSYGRHEEKLTALLGVAGASCETLFGDAAERQRLATAARAVSDVGRSVCNACCIIHRNMPDARLPGDVLLAALVGVGKRCGDKNQMDSGDPHAAGRLAIEAASSGALAGSDAYPLVRAVDDLRKVREMLENGDSANDRRRRGDALLEKHIALYAQLEAAVAAADAQAQLTRAQVRKQSRRRA